MTEPRYVGLQKDDIPSVENAGVTVNRIAGEGGALQSLTGIAMMTLEIKAGSRTSVPAPRGRNVFFYVVRGEVHAGGEAVPSFHLADFHHDGDSIDIEALAGAIVIYGHADPIGEPVVAYGPFVMNTREEILQAIRDFAVSSRH